MKSKLITGVVEGIIESGVSLSVNDKLEYIELNDEVLSGLTIGNIIRVVYTNQRIVRVFNISTEILYEVEMNLTKFNHKKKLTLIFFATSAICAIPIAGALIGLVLIAALIGSSIRYGRNVLAKVAGLSVISAIAYVAASTTLMLNGHFILSFVACTAIVYLALTYASKIQDSEALTLSKAAIGNDHCLNFKAVNL